MSTPDQHDVSVVGIYLFLSSMMMIINLISCNFLGVDNKSDEYTNSIYNF